MSNICIYNEASGTARNLIHVQLKVSNRELVKREPGDAIMCSMTNKRNIDG